MLHKRTPLNFTNSDPVGGPLLPRDCKEAEIKADKGAGNAAQTPMHLTNELDNFSFLYPGVQE